MTLQRRYVTSIWDKYRIYKIINQFSDNNNIIRIFVFVLHDQHAISWSVGLVWNGNLVIDCADYEEHSNTALEMVLFNY